MSVIKARITKDNGDYITGNIIDEYWSDILRINFTPEFAALDERGKTRQDLVSFCQSLILGRIPVKLEIINKDGLLKFNEVYCVSVHLATIDVKFKIASPGTYYPLRKQNRFIRWFERVILRR